MNTRPFSELRDSVMQTWDAETQEMYARASHANNSDYFSRPDRLDGLDTRGPAPRYVAAVDITGEPAKVTIPEWPKIDPLMWAPPAILLVLAVALLITDLVVRW